MKNIMKIPLLSVMAILLAGCSNGGGRAEEIVRSAEDIQEEKNKEEKTGSEEEPEHIKRTLADKLQIDADIIYPPDKELAVYPVKRKIFEKDSISLFLSEDEYIITENPNYENSFTVNTSGGSGLLVSEGYFSYIKNRKRDEDVASMIEDFLLKAEIIGEAKELSFMSKKEAIALGKEKIKELSGSNAEAVRTVAMDNEDLQKLQNNLLDEAGYQAGIESGKTNRIDKFSEDDVYYIQYAVKQDDIYLYDGITEPQISLAIDAYWDFSVNVTVLVGKDGIRYFNYRNAFSEPVAETEKAGIISADDVLDKIEKVYDGIILTEPVTITKLWIEYIPVPDWENLTRIELRPYWCVQINSGGGPGEAWSSVERIHALTGGNLSYGE